MAVQSHARGKAQILTDNPSVGPCTGVSLPTDTKRKSESERRGVHMEHKPWP